MTPKRWQQVEKIFEAAIERDPAQRASFLDEACAGDEQLRSEVESLIAADGQAGSFIEPDQLEAPTRLFIDDQAQSMAGRRFGPYEIIREIGHGGMGAVFLAVRADDEYQKSVAIKLVRGGMNSEFVLRRFLSERQILAALDHPNIARLIDGGTTDDGLPYFVMEYIEGLPIGAYCDKHKLTTTERLKLFRVVCSAVQYAHQNLVVHRDIKPSNILVTSEGIAKLLDFGIAKLLNPELVLHTVEPTATALRLMTPDYASPEQVRGEQITTSTDVYSLGLVLYELLTGHHPYQFKSRLPHEILRVICEEEPEKPSTAVTRVEEVTTSDGVSRITLTPESVSKTREGHPDKLRRCLAGDLDNIVLKAIRKEPNRRYSTAEIFSEDIRRHLERLPVMARKDTFSYRSGKFIKRHKTGVIAAGLIVVTLLAGIVATLWQARLVSAQRARAERRFNDVRGLANSFMFELHDEIKDLAGSTRARELLVKRALEYLDSLAQEAGDDSSLQRELAMAYERVGDVQGNPANANLGDTAGALESYRKALAIRELLVAADPANRGVRQDLALGYSRMGDILDNIGDTKGTLESYQKALAIREALSEADLTNVEVRWDLALNYSRMGNILDNTGDTAGALENYRKALTIRELLAATDPANTGVRRDLALNHSRMGDILDYTGDTRGALEAYQKALAINEVLAANDPMNAQARNDLALSYQKVGYGWLIIRYTEPALENYRKALAIRESLAAADPTNAQARNDLADSYHAIGIVLAYIGDTTGGLENHRKAMAIREALAAADPINSRVRRDLAYSYRDSSLVLTIIGDIAKALENLRKALAIFKELANRPEATFVDLNNYAYSLLACEPADLRNPAAALPYAKRAAEMRNGNDPYTLDTLALAYYMNGNQALAIETEKKAHSLWKGDSWRGSGSPQKLEGEKDELLGFKAGLKGHQGR